MRIVRIVTGNNALTKFAHPGLRFCRRPLVVETQTLTRETLGLCRQNVRGQSVSIDLVFGPSCPSDFLGGPFFLVRFFVVSLCRQRPFRGTFSVTRTFFSCSVSALRARQPDRALLSTRCSGKAWRPKIAPHSLLISACEKGEQPGRALEALQALQRQDLVPGDSAPQRFFF